MKTENKKRVIEKQAVLNRAMSHYSLWPTMIHYEPLIIYTKFFDNNINQSEDINKKTLKRCYSNVAYLGVVELGLGRVIVAQSGP